jgi:hypothetical protein
MPPLKIRQAIDRLAEVRSTLNSAKRAEQSLLEIIRPLGDGDHQGNRFIAHISTIPRESLDVESIRQDMSQRWINRHTKTQDIVTVRTREKS